MVSGYGPLDRAVKNQGGSEGGPPPPGDGVPPSISCDMLDELMVAPGAEAGLRGRSPDDRLGLGTKDSVTSRLDERIERLSALQNRLWSEERRSVLLVLQGMDTAGKDGAIRKVFTGVNPQGCEVASFKAPSDGELAHDYLWRVHARCPQRGQIGIFNRSHYEDVVAVRVRNLAPEAVWRRRYHHIREFERMLVDEGTSMLKVFLHISREEQKARLEARLEEPDKTWKFRQEDLEDRRRWDDFAVAYDEALTETSTRWAPWYVVPANHKYVRNYAVAGLLVDLLERLDPEPPPPPPGIDEVRVT